MSFEIVNVCTYTTSRPRSTLVYTFSVSLSPVVTIVNHIFPGGSFQNCRLLLSKIEFKRDNLSPRMKRDQLSPQIKRRLFKSIIKKRQQKSIKIKPTINNPKNAKQMWPLFSNFQKCHQAIQPLLKIVVGLIMAPTSQNEIRQIQIFLAQGLHSFRVAQHYFLGLYLPGIYLALASLGTPVLV